MKKDNRNRNRKNYIVEFFQVKKKTYRVTRGTTEGVFTNNEEGC